MAWGWIRRLEFKLRSESRYNPIVFNCFNQNYGGFKVPDWTPVNFNRNERKAWALTEWNKLVNSICQIQMDPKTTLFQSIFWKCWSLNRANLHDCLFSLFTVRRPFYDWLAVRVFFERLCLQPPLHLIKLPNEFNRPIFLNTNLYPKKQCKASNVGCLPVYHFFQDRTTDEQHYWRIQNWFHH